MDEVDVTSLGYFVSELDEEDLKQLSASASAEAVRQLGRLRFSEIPLELRRRKAQVALEMLVRSQPISGSIRTGSSEGSCVFSYQGRARGRQDKLQADELSADELQDLGSAALGLEPRELEQLQPEVFKDAVAWLGERESFEADQYAALANLAKETYK